MHRGLARVLPTSAPTPWGQPLIFLAPLSPQNPLAGSPFWPRLPNRPPLRKLTNVWWLDSAWAFPKPTLVCALAAAGGPCPRKAQPHKPPASRQRLFRG